MNAGFGSQNNDEKSPDRKSDEDSIFNIELSNIMQTS